MLGYSFIAGMAFLLGCFGLNEVQESRFESREAE